MPLIFSTYKLKLGGIIPTANLFSRFLEKNVEKSVDVFGFHPNPFVHWRFESRQFEFSLGSEVASSFKKSKAFPFWRYTSQASWERSAEQGFGYVSGYEKPVLFLPLWFNSSWEPTLPHGAGDFKSQALYAEAKQFFTQVGYQPYEISFDGSHLYAVQEGRLALAVPFFSEKGRGLTPVYDESRAGESWLTAARLEPAFHSYLNNGQSNYYLQYDERGELSMHRVEPAFHYYENFAAQLSFKHEEESSIGSYGSYDPFTPDSYQSGNIGYFLGSEFEATRISMSGAVSFYLMLEEGLDYPFLQIQEVGELSAMYAFEQYWYDVMESQSVNPEFGHEIYGDHKFFSYSLFWYDTYTADHIHLVRSTEESGAHTPYNYNSFWFDRYTTALENFVPSWTEASEDWKYTGYLEFFVSKFSGYDIPFESEVEASLFKQMYGFNEYWFDTYVAAKSNEYHTQVPESEVSMVGRYPMFFYALLPSTKLNQFDFKEVPESVWNGSRQFIWFFHYKNPGHELGVENLGKDAAPAVQSDSNATVMYTFTYSLTGASLAQVTPNYCESWRRSQSISFWRYTHESKNYIPEWNGVASNSGTRSTSQSFWHYKYQGIDVGMQEVGHNAVGRSAFFDIYYAYSLPSTNVPDSVMRGATYVTSIFYLDVVYYVNESGNMPNSYGWATGESETYFATPYINYTHSGKSANVKYSMELAQGTSIEVPPFIVAAFWVNLAKNVQQKYNYEYLFVGTKATMHPYQPNFKVGDCVQLVVGAELAQASYNTPSDPQPYYVSKFTGSMIENLLPVTATETSHEVFSYYDAVAKKLPGEDIQYNWGNLQQPALNSGLFGLELISDWYVFESRLFVGEALSQTKSLGSGVYKLVAHVINYTASSRDGGEEKTYGLYFNAKSDIALDRDFWYILPITYEGVGFKMVSSAPPSQFGEYAKREPSPITKLKYGQSLPHRSVPELGVSSAYRIENYAITISRNGQGINHTSIGEISSYSGAPSTFEPAIIMRESQQRVPKMSVPFLTYIRD